MSTKVFKVEHRYYMLAQNTWLGSYILVGGYYIGPKMAEWQNGAFARTIFVHFQQVPQPHSKVSDPNQSL